MFSPMVSLADLRTIQYLFTLWTLLHLPLCPSTGSTSLGLVSRSGYSLSRGRNPSPFKGISLEGLMPRILHPAWKCSPLPHPKQCMQRSSVLCCWKLKHFLAGDEESVHNIVEAYTEVEIECSLLFGWHSVMSNRAALDTEQFLCQKLSVEEWEIVARQRLVAATIPWCELFQNWVFLVTLRQF